MGRPKAMVTFGGRRLVERAAATLADGGCDPVVVVLGAVADEVRRTTSLPGAEFVDNPSWADGQSTSLRAGLAAVFEPARVPSPQAVLVSVVDQPGISPELVARLLATWRDGDAVAVVAAYDGAARTPVVLDKSVAGDVAASVTGDEGARRWLGERRRTAPGSVALVECGDVGRPDDVDTPADLAELSGSQDPHRPQQDPPDPSRPHDPHGRPQPDDAPAVAGRRNRSAR